jgi:hypothetical protein
MYARIENGKITEVAAYSDSAAVMQAMGFLPVRYTEQPAHDEATHFCWQAPWAEWEVTATEVVMKWIVRPLTADELAARALGAAEELRQTARYHLRALAMEYPPFVYETLSDAHKALISEAWHRLKKIASSKGTDVPQMPDLADILPEGDDAW